MYPYSSISGLARVYCTIALVILTSSVAWSYDVDCSNLPEWDAAAVYVGGDQVKYNGNMYQANYWTQGNNPEQYSDPYEHWTNLGACDGGNGGTNQAPSVNITSPASGSSFTSGSSITLEASASDADGTVVKVAFYADGTLLVEDTAAPFSYSWTGAAIGNHTITAKAFDDDNATATSAGITITVEGTSGGGCDGLPQYMAGSTYTQDQEVSNADQKFRCDVPGWCSSTAAWAYEPGVGMYWHDAWTYVGDCGQGNTNDPPWVAITAPFNGATFTEGGSLTITADAMDDGAVIKVEFFLDGTKIGEDTGSPYAFIWNNMTVGSHALTARATDNEGSATTSAAINITVNANGDTGNGDLPARILSGYWHNFNNGTGFIRLRDVSSNWDVINISFAEPVVSASDGQIGFALTSDAPADYTEAEFKTDIQQLQSQGKKIVISIGGANGTVKLTTTAARDKFVSSMIAIIEEYGFDGMDIDFEGQSLSLDLGDADFAHPTTPVIVNTIDAIRTVCDHFGADFILTMAPETFFVQLGYSFYGGISAGADRRAGAYLPVIHALRDKLTFLQVQYYNSGSITALDDRYYSMGNPDFYVSLVDMILKGFPITGDASKFFPPLRQDQVLIGLPAANGAGNGYIGEQGVQQALDYLIKGNSFGGQYQLTQTYPNLRGLMSWSINWDKANNYTFSNSHRAYLDALGTSSFSTAIVGREAQDAKIMDGGYPNPFTASTDVRFVVNEKAFTSLKVYDQQGKKVGVLVEKMLDKGSYSFTWDAADVPTGIYFFILKAGEKSTTFKVYKE